MKTGKISFGDVLGGEIPNTVEKVNERWMFLKSEHEKEDFKDAKKSIALIVTVGIITLLLAFLIS